MTLKLFQLIKDKIRTIFREKSCRKCASKASSRPLFNFVNNLKQPLHARKLRKKHFERGLSKSLIIFSLKHSPFYLARL